MVYTEAGGSKRLAAVEMGPFQDGSFDLDCAKKVSPKDLGPLVPGTALEYHSASLGSWLPAKLQGKGTLPRTINLDCKESADLCRVRFPPAPAPSSSALGSSSGRPLNLKAGDVCLYQSASAGWIPAKVLLYRDEDKTFDLDVKQRVEAKNIFTMEEGKEVEYHSTSTGQWIPAVIQKRCPEVGVYDLDCKPQVAIARIRPAPAKAPVKAPIPPTAMPGGYGAQVSAAALQSEHSASPSGGRGGFLATVFGGWAGGLSEAHESQAGNPALTRLREATGRQNPAALAAALDIAVAANVAEAELDLAFAALRRLEAPKLWRYMPNDGLHIDLRTGPDIDGSRSPNILKAGDVFVACHEERGNGGVTYLKLADGRGWAFDKKPGFGILCERYVVQGQDRPGGYVVVHDKVPVSSGLERVAGGGDTVARLGAGAKVTVLDVAKVQVKGEEVLRARIEFPEGWVSILEYSTGHRWMIPQPSGQQMIPGGRPPEKKSMFACA